MSISEFFGLTNYVSNQFALALIVFVASLIAFRILLSITEKILLRLTSKTKTDVDDIIIKKSSAPLTLLALIFALRLAVMELALSKGFIEIFSKILYSSAIILIGYILYVTVDTGLLRGWKHISRKTRVKIDENLTDLLHGTLKIILVILAILYILELWGVKIGPLLGALGIAGLAVALALQSTLGNIFSGVSLILDKSVKVGDWVVLDNGVWGIVEKIGIRSTKFRTFDNEMLVIPNTIFADSRIQNISMPEPKARVVIPFGVAYGSDIDKVKKVVKNVLSKLPHLDKTENISVRFLEMGESSLNFKAYFYIESFEFRLDTIDKATSEIYKALNKSGITIPFPQMDVHLKKD